ncbi:MAG: hypothetical protein IID40_05420 [Planctomycetes bacterium]|nr:hypothetical protein [Planctomycetota bacterium]
MDPIAGTPETTTALGGRTRESRRRLRVVRSVMLLLVMAVALCAAVVWQRNQVRIGDEADRFEGQIAGLIEALERTGTLPLSYPPLQPEKAVPARFNYIGADMVRQLRDDPEPYIVAYTDRIRRVLGADVRLVAIRDGGRIRIEQMGVAAFVRRWDAQTARAGASGVDGPDEGDPPP